MKRRRLMLVAVALLLATEKAPAGEKLTLEESRRLALENNGEIRNSRMETEAAREAKRAAFTRFFPTIQAGAVSFRAEKPLMEFTVPGGNLPVYDGNPVHLATATQFAYFPSSTMGLFGRGTFAMVNAVQPVFAGGRIANANRLASLGVEAGGIREQLVCNQVLLVTEEQYWRVVALDRKLETAARYREFLERLLGKATASYEAGLTGKNELMKVRLKFSELKVNESRLRNGREISLMALCQTIGIPCHPGLELEETPVGDENPDALRVDHSAALAARPEYKLLQAALRSERLQGRMKLGEFLPQAGIGVAGIFMKSDDRRGTANGIVYGTLSVPLSGWWEAAYIMRERKTREKIARNNLRDRSEALLIGMEKAWQDLADAGRLLRFSKEALAQAEENLEVNAESYENGMSDLSDLLEAQAMRQQALDQVTEASTGYQLKAIRYLQATGR